MMNDSTKVKVFLFRECDEAIQAGNLHLPLSSCLDILPATVPLVAAEVAKHHNHVVV
jgi:hypothetical protein